MPQRIPFRPDASDLPLAKPPERIPTGSLATVRRKAKQCRDCPLWMHATQTVFGEGPADAQVMLIGEQPGAQEDLQGAPFVGPAGRMLDKALTQAGLSREAVYLTNTVKHFKFEPRGKARLHKRANAAEQAACRQWLAAELLRLFLLRRTGDGRVGRHRRIGLIRQIILRHDSPSSRLRSRWTAGVLSNFSIRSASANRSSAWNRMSGENFKLTWRAISPRRKRLLRSNASSTASMSLPPSGMT